MELRALRVLEEQLDLIEEQIDRGRNTAQFDLDAKIQDLPTYDGGKHDESDWDTLYKEHRSYVEVTLPRILRNPFPVTLFAVYESAVKEIAKLIQKETGQKISLGDIRGSDFLDQAKKYYKHVLQFELSEDNKRWKRLKILSDLRNAIAHGNGRVNMVKEETMKRIRKQRLFKEECGFLIVSRSFLRETVKLVKEDLEDLLARYKKWETAKSPR